MKAAGKLNLMNVGYKICIFAKKIIKIKERNLRKDEKIATFQFSFHVSLIAPAPAAAATAKNL